MTFVKGQPRPENSGRKLGTPNKKSVAKVSDYLGEKDINPAEEILKIINEKKLVTDTTTNLQREVFALDSAARADLWLELLAFCHAKPKSLELIRGNPDDNLDEFDQVPTDDLMRVINNNKITGTA